MIVWLSSPLGEKIFVNYNEPMGTSQIPVAVGDPTSPDARLSAACDHAQRLHDALEDLIHHRDVRRDGINRSATISHCTPPWNSRIAYLIFDLAKMARTLESNLHLMISGSQTVRGTSDRNTQLALRALPNLALGLDEEVTSLVTRQVEQWCLAARVAIGEAEPFIPLPRSYGQGDPRCPWCQRHTLRAQVTAGLVRCLNPGCLDDQGHRPIARIEIGAYGEEPQLVWQDQSFALEL